MLSSHRTALPGIVVRPCLPRNTFRMCITARKTTNEVIPIVIRSIMSSRGPVGFVSVSKNSCALLSASNAVASCRKDGASVFARIVGVVGASVAAIPRSYASHS